MRTIGTLFASEIKQYVNTYSKEQVIRMVFLLTVNGIATPEVAAEKLYQWLMGGILEEAEKTTGDIITEVFMKEVAKKFMDKNPSYKFAEDVPLEDVYAYISGHLVGTLIRSLELTTYYYKEGLIKENGAVSTICKVIDELEYIFAPQAP